MSWLLKLFSSPSKAKDPVKETPDQELPTLRTMETDVSEFKIKEDELDSKIVTKIKKAAESKANKLELRTSEGSPSRTANEINLD